MNRSSSWKDERNPEEDGPQQVPGLLKTVPSAGDLIGGVSVALVLIPQAIAYATVAGVPAEVGLFAASIPLIAAAPFVSCPWIQTGPTAMTSLLAGGAIAGLGCELENPQQIAAAAALLAIVVGTTRLAMGLLRIGNLTRYLIRPVILGFTTAAAVLIICSQLSKTLGTTIAETSVVLRAIKSLTSLDWSFQAIGVAVGTAVIASLSKKIHRLFPAILLAIVLAIVYSYFTGYEGATVEKLSGSFISFRTDLPWNQVSHFLLPGMIIAFVGFAEPTSISMTLMEEENLEWNPNRLCENGIVVVDQYYSWSSPNIKDLFTRKLKMELVIQFKRRYGMTLKLDEKQYEQAREILAEKYARPKDPSPFD